MALTPGFYLRDRMRLDEGELVSWWGFLGPDPFYPPLGEEFAFRTKPRYKSGDENAVPDLIINVENPPEDYLINNMLGWKFVDGARLTYECFRYYKAGIDNHWKIRLILQYTSPEFGESTFVLYPYGSESYSFNPENVREYLFELKY